MSTLNSKGTFVFDVDGVLLDFYAPFLQWYNAQHGTTFVVSDLTRYDIASGLNIDPQTIVDFHQEESCGSLPLLDLEAPLLLARLQQAGYKVILNTDWPLEHLDKRLQNLALYQIPYDAIIVGKKADLPLLYPDIVLIVEDNPHWIRLYAAHHLHIAVPYREYLRDEHSIKAARVFLRYGSFSSFYTVYGIPRFSEIP